MPRENDKGQRAPRAGAATAPAALWHLLILAGVSFILYAETLGDGFILDDKYEAVNNPLIRSFANLPALFAHSTWFFSGAKVDNYYRPLKLLAYSLEYHLFGFETTYWHLVNILINVAAVLAIYVLARDLCVPASVSGRGPASASAAGVPARADLAAVPTPEAGRFAFWTALFFAFHPVHVEPVAWVAGGSDLFCGLMLVLALWLYHRARFAAAAAGGAPPDAPREAVAGGIGGAGVNPGAATLDPASRGAGARSVLLYAGSLLLFFAGMLFKETALTFPAVVLAFDFFLRREPLREILRGWRRYLVYFAALAVYLVMRFRALRGFAPATNQFHVTVGQMFLSVPVLAARYVWKTLAPVNLNYWHFYQPVRTLGWKAAVAAIICLVLVAAMFWFRRRQPLLSFALAWFWLTLIPVLDIPKVGIQVFTERYLYVPSLGFCLFAAWVWIRVREWAGGAPRGAAGGGPASVSRPGGSAARWVASAALVVIFILYAGIILRRLPDWHDEFALVARTAEQSPNVPAVQSNLGLLYKERGNLPAALDRIQRAIALAPGYPYFRNNLASLDLSLGRYDDAIRELQIALQIDSTAPPFWLNLCTAYNAKSDWAQAIAACERGIALDPNNPRDIFNYDLLAQLGLTQWKSGQHALGIDTYHRAIALDPIHLEARFYLAISLADEGQYDAAVEQLLAGLRTDPNSPDAYLAHYELGGIYQLKQRWLDAAQQYQAALQENPGYTAAQVQLNSVRARLARSNQ